MKLFLALILSFSISTSFGAMDEAALENAAATELGIVQLETFDWRVEQGPLVNLYNVEFSYDQEFFDTAFDIVTFNCTGTVKAGATLQFIALNCIEEEPLLWDEF